MVFGDDRSNVIPAKAGIQEAFVLQTNKRKKACILNVASQGETVEEAKKNIIEAVTLYLETAIESNLPIIRSVQVKIIH